MIGRGLRAFVLAIVTALREKNPAKTVTAPTGIVFSMARVIVLGFAIAMVRQMWRAGIAAWPEIALAIVIVLALPILSALDRVNAGEVVALAKVLLERVGARAPAFGSAYSGTARRNENRPNAAPDDKPDI